MISELILKLIRKNKLQFLHIYYHIYTVLIYLFLIIFFYPIYSVTLLKPENMNIFVVFIILIYPIFPSIPRVIYFMFGSDSRLFSCQRRQTDRKEDRQTERKIDRQTKNNIFLQAYLNTHIHHPLKMHSSGHSTIYSASNFPSGQLNPSVKGYI